MKTFFKFIVILTLLSGLAGAGAVWLAYWYYARDLPELNSLADYHPALVTRVYARDYQLMGEFFVERRQFVPRADVPADLVNAFLAIEDTDFYRHPGIDFLSIFRAMFANVQAGRVVQGASTITQQVARTFLLSSERTMERKIREMILAVRIDQQLPKDAILELYLNQIYLGAGAYGVGAASRIYFNADISELTLGQCALLAGLPKAPSHYDPWQHPEAAARRQKVVLNRMAAAGFITQEAADAASAAPLDLAHPERPLEQVAPHFLEYVRQNVMAEWGMDRIYRDGLDIYTTLDPPLQKAAHAAVRAGLIAYDRRHGYRGPVTRLATDKERQAWLAANRQAPLPASGYLAGVVTKVPKEGAATVQLARGDTVQLPLEGVRWARKRLEERRVGPAVNRLADVVAVGDVVLVELPAPGEKKPVTLAQEPDTEAALVAIDPHTGQILAMVGGYDFNRSEFNRAIQGSRQPGSSFKPFIYAAALDNGFTPASIIDDSPLPVPYQDSRSGQTKIWQPENYDHRYLGPITMRTALENSRNLPTIRLLKSVGVPKAVNFFKRFGFTIAEGRWNLSLALGSIDFSPLRMVYAYTVFANGGKRVAPVYISRVQDRFGRTVHRHGGGDCLLCHGETAAPGVTQQAANTVFFGHHVIRPEVAYQVTSMLKGVIQRGTGQKAKVLGRPLAGKTGTSNDLRDAWFIGYSPSLVTGVWVGRDDNGTLGGKETGAQAALPIWIDFMKVALASQPDSDFPVPPGIQVLPVDDENGRLVSPDTPHAVMEAFKLGEEPDIAAPFAGEGPGGEGVKSVEDGLY